MKKMKVALAIVALLAVVLISVAFLDKGELKYTNSPYYEEIDDIFVFNTREGLDDYIKTNNEKYLLDVDSVEYNSFVELTNDYNEKYFEKKDLAVIRVNKGTGSCKFSLEDVEYEDGNLLVTIKTYYSREYVDHILTGFHVIVEIDKLEGFKNAEFRSVGGK